MLGENLNGLKLSCLPGEIGNALLSFKVTEHYKDESGKELYPSYNISVPSESFRFESCDNGYIMFVRPSAFGELEKQILKKKPIDVMIYPSF